jgi:type IV pilus assembly protein PilA
MARPLLEPRPMARKAARGFTLIELAIVVVIVGILAVIAVVGYRKIINSGKTTEAQNVISAIRVAQQDFFAERGTYADIGTQFCPAAQSCPACVGTTKSQWTSACGNGTTGTGTYDNLAVHIADPVLFGYRTRGGGNYGGDPNLSGTITWVNWGGMVAGRPWFQIHAMGDVNADGAPYTEFATSSSTNQIFSQNLGE